MIIYTAHNADNGLTGVPWNDEQRSNSAYRTHKTEEMQNGQWQITRWIPRP